MIDERLTFEYRAGGRFEIGPAALGTIRSYVQSTPEVVEAGGVLLGRHILATYDIVVDHVTTPLPGDRQSRVRFFRSRQRHQALIDQSWRESEGTCTYLGEWHTHPESYPAPSRIDWMNWERKLWVDRFTEPIFFVIVGIVEIRVWEGYRRARPRLLDPV